MGDWSKPEIRLFQEPKLNQPFLVAAWPGVGNIALGAVSYLREKLGAKLFGEIDPHPFFESPGVFIEDNLIQPPRFPKSQFFFWRRPQPGRDLIILEGEAQPSRNSYELAHRVIDVAQRLGADRIFTLAAALVATPTENPRVWATASDAELVTQLRAQGAVLQGNFFVAGMNGLLLAVARERGLSGVCFLGETFRLLPQMENPVAALAVLKALAQALDIQVDTRDLEAMAQQAKAEMARMVSESQQKFLDDFTIPLWQREEEDKA